MCHRAPGEKDKKGHEEAERDWESKVEARDVLMKSRERWRCVWWPEDPCRGARCLEGW